MQLSTATSSPDLSLTSLFPPGLPPGTDGALAPALTGPTGNGLAGFAELFPNLAAPGNGRAGPTPAATGESPALFSFAAPPANVAEVLPPAFASPTTARLSPLTPTSESLENGSEIAGPATTDAEPSAETISPPLTGKKTSRIGTATPRPSSASAPRPASNRAPLTAKISRSEDSVPLVFPDGLQISVPERPTEFSAEVVPETGEEPSQETAVEFLSSREFAVPANRGPAIDVRPRGNVAANGGELEPVESFPSVQQRPDLTGMVTERTPLAPEQASSAESKPAMTLAAALEPASAAPRAPEDLPIRENAPAIRGESPTRPTDPEARALPQPGDSRVAESLPAERGLLPDLPAEPAAVPVVARAAEFVPRPTTDLRQFLGEIPAVENFADAAPDFRSPKKDELPVSDKTFLSPLAKRVATRETTLGTAVAKSEAVMSTATFSHRPPSAVALDRAPVPAPPVGETVFATRTDAPIPAEATATAHRAVEAVHTAVERFSTGDRHAVNMQFSVGGADLTVRVELRSDQVHATFRTDSPELRAALAAEWSAATPEVGDRSLRLAPPVFAGAGDANLGAFSSDTSPRERDARSRRTAEEFSAVVAGRSRGSSVRTPAPTEFLPRLPAAGTAGTALHLSTLA